ncbi:MAG: tetratricopeptide repeat protein [Candidatus Eremiobacteraeota bacterium]|nr:tetratricopeptide repeat protein [Candidatus Eremiobacteraeota bacterium]
MPLVEHSNLSVRRLLRKLRYPGDLERDHYAQAVRDAANSSSAHSALMELLDDVLRRYPPVYWAIIKRIDVDGESPKSVANALYLSYRTLHRYRSAAIAAVAEALERRFGMPREGPAASDTEAEGDVGVLALVGEGFNHLRRHSVRSFEAASRCFARALEIDERCADAWIGLASCHEHQAVYLERDAIASFDAAMRALDRAARLAPRRADAFAIRSETMLHRDRDYAAAAAAIAAALDADSESSAARTSAASLALAEGDVDAALAHARRAVVHEPESLDARATYGIALLAVGDFDSAARWLRSVLDVEPSHYLARHYLPHALIGLREYDACAAHLASFGADERTIVVEAIGAHLEGRTGNAGEVERWLATAADRGDGDGTRYRYARALAYAGIGARDEAIAELEAAVRADEPLITACIWDPLFAELHQDGRFVEVVERVRRPARDRAAQSPASTAAASASSAAASAR